MSALSLSLPRRGRGRSTAAAESTYQESLRAFCEGIIQIRSTLDFEVSARGWCYILEDHGLKKGDFDSAETLIADCRKSGLLPLSIVAEDGGRRFENLEWIDNHTPMEEAEDIVARMQDAHTNYNPISFWDFQPCYIEMLVEKVDLRSLFRPVCAEYAVPIANARGWADINTRAAMMRRFAKHELSGRKCILLYCGDHDPAGLAISRFLRSNLAELGRAVDWYPENLKIERFGLNADFIAEHKLSWIDNLETGGGKNLADPKHPNHHHDYVQNYIRQFGVRKVEANALVVRPEAGRALCRAAIVRHVDLTAVPTYQARLNQHQEAVKGHVRYLVGAE